MIPGYIQYVAYKYLILTRLYTFNRLVNKNCVLAYIYSTFTLKHFEHLATKNTDSSAKDTAEQYI